MRAAGAGDEAEAGLRLAEDRRLGRDDDVARHRELAAAAEAEAGHGGDERRAQRADRVPGVDPAVDVHLDGRGRRHLADVGAGGEHPLGAAEDDAADLRVGVELLKRRDDLRHQLGGERVQLLRPVEEDGRDRRLALDARKLSHCPSPRIA